MQLRRAWCDTKVLPCPFLKELNCCFIDSELKFSFRYLSNFDNFWLIRAWCNLKVLLCPHSIAIELLVTQYISFLLLLAFSSSWGWNRVFSLVTTVSLHLDFNDNFYKKSLPIISIYIFSITLIDSYNNMAINICSVMLANYY